MRADDHGRPDQQPGRHKSSQHSRAYPTVGLALTHQIHVVPQWQIIHMDAAPEITGMTLRTVVRAAAAIGEKMP